MTVPAVRVEHLGKRYRIGDRYDRAETLSGQIWSALRRPLENFRRVRRLTRFGKDVEGPVVWALRDVSFSVEPGEVLGVVGPNGAGKSTLLRMLARISAPTRGRIELRGRVGSILEVGTGFHAELTGRENVYLNGTALGMSRDEIDEKLDEIVAFSEIGRFIDTPVKRYSSGMYVRLAFSVAAHLESDVLLVDEVLAVGDAGFRRKCLNRMDRVVEGGRAVLLVSHHMDMVRRLCDRVLVLRDGRRHFLGETARGIRRYMELLRSRSESNLGERSDRRGRGALRVAEVECTATGRGAEADGMPATGGPVRISVRTTEEAAGLQCVLRVRSEDGRPVTSFNSRAEEGTEGSWRQSPSDRLVCEVDPFLLTPGTYVIDVSLLRNGVLEDQLLDACFFDVRSGSVGGRASGPVRDASVVALPHRWREGVSGTRPSDGSDSGVGVEWKE